MNSSQIFEEIQGELQDTDKILLIGYDSLSHALYISGKSREIGKPVDTQAIIPPDSNIKTEKEAMEKSDERNLLKKGIPNTYYRVGSMDMEDSKYQIVIDTREEELQRIGETMSKVEKGGKAVLTLPKDYLYPIKGTWKGLIRKKKVLKPLREILEDMGLEMKSLKILNKDRVISKIKKNKFKNRYTDINIPKLNEVGEQVVEESMPEVTSAMEEASFCIESQDNEYLYHFTKVEDIEGEEHTFHIEFLTGETEVKKEADKEIAKEMYVKVYPNFEEFEEKVKDTGDLIIPKKRVIDYYS